MTTDGGATWEELVLPEDVSKVAAVSLRTPTDGYLVDVNGVLHITQDEGKTWSSQSMGLDEDAMIMDLDTPQAAVRFSDVDNGLVILGLLGGGNSGIVAFRTADGGETWEEEGISDRLGMPYLTRDSAFFTVYTLNSREIVVFQYE